MTFITIGLIVFVAALNILISLIMMVMEKTKDIAVLMSLGTKKKQIRRVFIAQGVLIGVIGTAIGLVIGYAISWTGGHSPLHLALRRGLFHRLRPLRTAPDRRSDRRAGLDRHLVRSNHLSLMVRSANSPSRSLTIRIVLTSVSLSLF